MRSVAAILVATTLLLHGLLGCCSHHAHGGKASCDAHAAADHDGSEHGLTDYEHGHANRERSYADSRHLAQAGDGSCSFTHADDTHGPGHSSDHCLKETCSFVALGTSTDGTAKQSFAGEIAASFLGATQVPVAVRRDARASAERWVAPHVPLYLRLQVLLT